MKAEGGRRKAEGSSPVDLRLRTRDFALRVIRLQASLPATASAQVLGRQVLRSGTSVGAHYREAKRARSQSEFISKIEVAQQELDETDYWLELLAESGIIDPPLLKPLRQEADELMAILCSISRRLKSK